KMKSPVVRMLVVQVNRDLASTIKTFFERSQFEVTLADKGKEAADILRETPHFDIVLIDLSSHGSNSLDLLTLIRRMSVGTPVLAFVPRNDDAGAVRCLELGADDCLVGPFGMNLLAAHVRAILRRTAVRHHNLNPRNLTKHAIAPPINS